MISAQAAISRARRDLTVGAILKWLLISCAIVGMFLTSTAYIFAIMAGIWLLMSFRSVQGSRLAAGSSSLIASGQFDEAERAIEQSLKSFSMFRSVKLLSLHHLAQSRHAQRRWRDAAALCQELLGQKLGPLRGISGPAAMMLADSLLELNDLNAAYYAINALYAQRLPLSEAMNLLQLQLDYESRIGAWGAMFNDIAQKAQIAEMLPTAQAARLQAFLALAAQKVAGGDWERWLRRRVELLVDVEELIAQRPILRELWVNAPESKVT